MFEHLVPAFQLHQIHLVATARLADAQRFSRQQQAGQFVERKGRDRPLFMAVEERLLVTGRRLWLLDEPTVSLASAPGIATVCRSGAKPSVPMVR